MNQARLSNLRLERGLLDAETSQHGYLLTGRKEYLEPYEKALLAIKEVLQYQDQHFEDAPKERNYLANCIGRPNPGFRKLSWRPLTFWCASLPSR